MRWAFAVALICAISTSGSTVAAQDAPSAGLATPGRPGSNRTPVGPVDNERFRSTIVTLGGGARDGLLYEPKADLDRRVAVLYSDRNFGFDPPAAELAARGYRVLYVSYPALHPGKVAMPLDGFVEISRGIAYLRALQGVERVVLEGWGAGASSVTLYADVAAHGPTACQGAALLSPCPTGQASDLAKPDGLILLDPGLGSGTKVTNVDPAVEPDGRRRADLDMLAVANGYRIATGDASYTPAFRKRYFAAQTARNTAAVAQAEAKLRAAAAADEPVFVPGAVNAGFNASLASADTRLLFHTKRPHLLLRPDGSRATVILRSLRPASGPVGNQAVAAAATRAAQPARATYTLREYLANDAIRTDGRFALTQDDVVGVDWSSSNLGTPAQAEGVAIPTLLMSNTCFQFVVPAEIVLDHLASKDKTLVGVEGSAHEFGPCKPEYGDTKRRLFDHVAQWLSRPGRF